MQQYPEERKNIIDKGDRKGKYLMPELYGQPEEKAMIKKSKITEQRNLKATTKREKYTATQK
jgi:hypothetical protein